MMRPTSRAIIAALAAALVAGVSVAAIGPRVRELAYERALLVRKQPASEAPRRARAAANAVKESDRAIAPAPAHVDEVPAVKLDDLPVAREAPSGESRVPAHASRTPSALFRSANEARRAGDDARAIALYRALESEFPSSPEARLSHATIGRLMLDRGDAQRALTDFDEYLSNGGAALGEEALVGRALALGKLGQKEAEASAWREVLRRFPRSIHARLAQTRLAALDEP
jgi:TolA-binding protein